jgi:hypothetical protein
MYIRIKAAFWVHGYVWLDVEESCSFCIPDDFGCWRGIDVFFRWRWCWCLKCLKYPVGYERVSGMLAEVVQQNNEQLRGVS